MESDKVTARPAPPEAPNGGRGRREGNVQVDR